MERVKEGTAKGVLAMSLAGWTQAMQRKTEQLTFPEYPAPGIRRFTFQSGGDHGWKISAIQTIRAKPAPWKFVVVTGAPSWSKYWIPVMQALPQDREMVVVDRPGFGCSEPATCVPDIRLQAEALTPLLQAEPGQRIVLIGKSYGAAIATLMAGAAPRPPVEALVLMAGYFGEFGPMAEKLVGLGGKLLKAIPRDLRHAIMEVTGQRPQLPYMLEALARLNKPVHVIHGERDDYAPMEVAERLVSSVRTRRPVRFTKVPNGSHFLNEGSPAEMAELLESCIPHRRGLAWPSLRLPQLQMAERTPQTA
jgi:pimeloyl-ACP methyl ester carboxylesterase